MQFKDLKRKWKDIPHSTREVISMAIFGFAVCATAICIGGLLGAFLL